VQGREAFMDPAPENVRRARVRPHAERSREEQRAGVRAHEEHELPGAEQKRGREAEQQHRAGASERG